MTILQRIFRSAEDENRRVILATMSPRPGARFLDLGCGAGTWTVEVAGHLGTEDRNGVEFVPELAERARARGITVTEADLSQPLESLEDASFDIIHSNQVIEHLAGTDTFMGEIRRLLRPDGYALISTNNLSSWHNIASLVMGWQPLPCNVSDWVHLGNPCNAFPDCEHDVRGQTHLRVFTGKALTALAEHHGLRPVSERGAGYYPLPTAIGRRLASIDRRHAAFLVHRFERA